MNNRELCHVWANQQSATGKGSNLFFEGETIYSYGRHFPLGMILTLPGERQPIAVLNPRRYSISTSKHQSFARSAVCHLEIAFIDPNVSDWNHIQSRADLESAKLKQEAQDKADAEEDNEYKRSQAKRKREQAKAAKVALANYPADLEIWRDGGKLPAAYQQFPVALRIAGDGVETTKGAKVPVALCKRVWPKMKAAVKAETANPSTSAWTPFFSLPDFKWGHYVGLSLRRIALGSPVWMKVGCHEIPWSEIETLAAKLNLK